MLMRKKFSVAIVFSLLFFTAFSLPEVSAQKKEEYSAIVNHLKNKYQAKKVKIPFMWLARFAVKVVRPAGVKSFDVTLFEDLHFSKETLDVEMQSVMRNSLSPEWLPILRVRSRTGEQVYMYMREDGKNVRLMLVTIDKGQAAVIRAKFNPEKLADFINNPKIFGISLGDGNDNADNKAADSNIQDSGKAGKSANATNATKTDDQ